MTDTVTDIPRVYHSFRSPYSRLGLHIVKRHNLKVRVVPFDGPPEGNAFQNPTDNPLKLKYYLEDVPRMTLRMGLRIRPPASFDVDFSPANKALTAAELSGVGLDFAIAVADARWGYGKDISDVEVVKGAAEKINWSAESVVAAQSDPAIADMHAEHRRMIADDGVFGVPFAVGGGQRFWGHDRFELLADLMKK
ncbi:MAG: DsbA family protein [Pseudomonadota bacterium]